MAAARARRPGANRQSGEAISRAGFLFFREPTGGSIFLYNAVIRSLLVRSTSSMATKKNGARSKKAPTLKSVQAQVPTATSEGSNTRMHASVQLDAGLEE